MAILLTGGPTSELPLLFPSAVLELSAEEADRLLEDLEANVPVHEGLVRVPKGSGHEAVVFGDTHGDWRSTLLATEEFLQAPGDRWLIGLGDYVDRAPEDCGEGSVANALYLLNLAARFPNRVILIQGNHETQRRIAVLPHDLPEEVDQLWGPVEERYVRILALLERGPFAAVSHSGAYFAHAGFPRTLGSGSLDARFRPDDEDRLVDLVWAELAPSRIRRGVGLPIEEPEFDRFLDRIRANVFLRGHDPDLAGRPVFHNRCLTLHTTRHYERYGGVLWAKVPLDRTVRSLDDIVVERRVSGAVVPPRT